MRNRSYSELSRLKTFEERFNYLRLDGTVGIETFGGFRYLNQAFYKGDLWKRVRRDVIIRDDGLDLGVDGFDIFDQIVVHHMNPVTIENIKNLDPICFDMNNLITVSKLTHKAIHYGDIDLLPLLPSERKPGDTKLW